MLQCNKLKAQCQRVLVWDTVLALSRSGTCRSATCRDQTFQLQGMSSQRQVFIQGITHAGRAFRPSDWAERLAGAMSSFRPGGGVGGIGAFIGYSPYCFPRVIDGVKCVIVSEELRGIEPMAWDFVMNFARDNELQVFEACLLPEMPAAPTK